MQLTDERHDKVALFVQEAEAFCAAILATHHLLLAGFGKLVTVGEANAQMDNADQPTFVCGLWQPLLCDVIKVK